MPKNAIFEAAALAASFAYLGVWVWSPRFSKPLLALVNLAMAIAIIAYNAMPPAHVLHDTSIVTVLALEVVVCAAALGALFRNPHALVFSTVAFVVNTVAFIVLLYAGFVLHIDRLI